ncbi:unnamed protein product [Paramecium sonneborni]|uniref:Uncharacterized protein n=1 Tax=Paramecium sonneborni TaxID=65129 RepID=A0A8S1M6X1_9CILI|nr:unnamed protein product [Paramecium sonneborni]
MNVAQVVLLKIQRFNQIYHIPQEQCINTIFQNWEARLVQPLDTQVQKESIEEALSILNQNNQILLMTEEEIFFLISIGLTDHNHMDCSKVQQWFDTNFDKYLLSYFSEQLNAVINQQMINGQIQIQEVTLDEGKPKVEQIQNEYYNREGLEFAKSLK